MIRIGDVEVHRVEEIIIHEPMTLFADFRQQVLDENRGWLAPHYYDEKREMFPTSIHSWLLKTPGRTILIDTCGGNGKTRPISPRFHLLDTPYLDRLKAAGAGPEDIDTVILTHLHIDHVGWNTRFEDGQWVPTFPNATYVMSRVERDAHDPLRGARDKPEGVNLPFLDSVQPVLDRAKVQLVEGNESLFEGIDLLPVPGHTPGQMAVRLRSGGQEMLFCGDIMHQPIQIAAPDWNSKYCADQTLARETRKRMLAYAADTGCLLAPVHFGWPYCGYIERRGDGFTFVPADEEP